MSRVASVLDRLMAKVDQSGECWIWTGSITTGGYGRIKTTSTRAEYVHRVAFEALVGPVPAGLELDHLCGVRACCNPQHLEPVSHEENVRRADSFWAGKTHCPHGHEYTTENEVDIHGRRISAAKAGA